jgi:hypothetical protein
VKLVASDPCFEFWLLLHFEYSAAVMSAADALARLQRHMPGYYKADTAVFDRVCAGLYAACRHAARLDADYGTSGATSPMSDMPKLVEELRSMVTGR